MNRRNFVVAVACISAATFGLPASAAPIEYPHERLADVWEIMKKTPGGPAAMRAAVEREFGSGILRFSSPYGAVVLLDTNSIDFWDGGEFGGMSRQSHAAAKVKIVRGMRRKDHWSMKYPIACT